jgi:hypothetical protein
LPTGFDCLFESRGREPRDDMSFAAHRFRSPPGRRPILGIHPSSK